MSIAATSQPGSAPETSQATRPASQSSTSRINGGPASGFAPVHCGTAVVRNPAIAAATKPNSVS